MAALVTNDFKDEGIMRLIPWKIDSAGMMIYLSGSEISLQAIYRFLLERGGA